MQGTELHILILNSNLRITDSNMVNYYIEKINNQPGLQILFATEFNQIKNDFDIQQGQILQRDTDMPVYYVQRLKQFTKGLKSLLPKISHLYLYTQDTYYNMQTVAEIGSVVQPKSVQYTYISGKQDLQSVGIGEFKCSVYLFQDYLCSNIHSKDFRLSNSYSWFNRHFIQRDPIIVHNASMLKKKSTTFFIKQLRLKPITAVPINKTIYPEQSVVWKSFGDHLINYSQGRERLASLFDFSISASSFQSPFLSSGVVSTAQILNELDLQNPGTMLKKLLKRVNEKYRDPNTGQLYTLTKLKESIHKYRDEILWAEFCHLYWLNNKQSLIINGELVSGGLYNRNRKWIKNPKLLKQFEFGSLDNEEYSLVNAAMNQLRTEGYMSNYLRMIVASFCLQQKLDWRDCLPIFEKYLIDINWASNLYGWVFSYNLVQGQPRIFSIPRQIQKRDKDGSYRKKWLK